MRGELLIARLTGKLLQKQPTAIIVDVGGVGYELIVPLSTFYDLGPIGSEVTLRAYTYVREDALQLYGFNTDRERRLFLMLTSVGRSATGRPLRNASMLQLRCIGPLRLAACAAALGTSLHGSLKRQRRHRSSSKGQAESPVLVGV